MSYDKFPFEDSESFMKGKWYPMPVGGYWHDGPKTYLDGYMIFKLIDDRENGDIEPICGEVFNLKTAVSICESFNGEMFEEFRR